MARKPGKPKRKSAVKSTRGGRAKGTVPDRIIDAALTLAAEDGWRRLTLAKIADAAGVSLAELRVHFSSKEAIIGSFVRAIDDKVLAAGPADGSSARDRLFEVLMRRFDALKPHKKAVRALAADSLCDPATALCRLGRVVCAMAWMLEAAGLSSAGPAGTIRAKGLAAVYLLALRAWFTDDSPDLARTMAVLDRGLGRAEAAVNFVCRARSP